MQLPPTGVGGWRPSERRATSRDQRLAAIAEYDQMSHVFFQADRIARKSAELTQQIALGRPSLYSDCEATITMLKYGIDGAECLIAEGRICPTARAARKLAEARNRGIAQLLAGPIRGPHYAR